MRIRKLLECPLRDFAEVVEIELHDFRETLKCRDQELGCHQEQRFEIVDVGLVV